MVWHNLGRRPAVLKRILHLAVLPAALVAFAPSMASASASNQINFPSPDTQPFLTVHVDVDNRTTIMTTTEEGGHSDPLRLGVRAGLIETDFFDVEFGVELWEQTDDPWYFNAKVAMKEEAFFEFSPAVAVGIFDLGTNPDTTAYRVLYALVAKTLPGAGRISAGYYYGNEDLLLGPGDPGDGAFPDEGADAGADADVGADPDDEEDLLAGDNHGFFLSWDRTLAEFDDRLWVALEYVSGESQYGAFSFAGSWRFSPHVSLLVGYTIFNNTDVAGESMLNIQLDIDL